MNVDIVFCKECALHGDWLHCPIQNLENEETLDFEYCSCGERKED